MIARIAAGQHGVVTRSQLIAAGLGRGAIDHRLGQGRLHRAHPGVYLVGHPVPTPLARELAAVLSYGEGAVLSHRSAAALWGLGPPTRTIDVTVPGRNCRSRSAVRAHRARRLDARDVRRRRQIPLTAPARTLLDLADVLGPRELARAVEEAQVLRLVRRDQLVTVLDRSPGRRGAGPIRALMDRDFPPAFTRSEAEERLLALLRAAELAPTAVNARIGAHEVDFLWRRQRLVAELDGFAYHASRAAFERDRGRDAELQAAGYRVVRVTWRQLRDRPEAVVARLAQALAR